VSGKWKASWTAVYRNALPIAVNISSGSRDVLEVELQVIGDEQIQVTIPVVIKKRAPRAPSDFGCFQTGFFGDIFESPVAKVSVKSVLAIIGAKQIFIAVVVVVTDAHAVGPANRLKTSLSGNVGKCSVAIVFI
jgi:hypothetical protein